jgi:hypothetical protein
MSDDSTPWRSLFPRNFRKPAAGPRRREYCSASSLKRKCPRSPAAYPDANDSASSVQDPIHKLLLGRDLASQPTSSRLENRPLSVGRARDRH